MQAVCDSDYRFTFSSTSCPGSTHDSVAFVASRLSRFLERPAKEGLPDGYWIAEDEAYSCCDRVLTPWPGRGNFREKYCFNYWLSSARIHIEQVFGLLVGRLGYFGDQYGHLYSKWHA